MNNSEDYSSVADRQRAAQARVHSDLTGTSRQRISQITSNPLRWTISDIDGVGNIPGNLVEKAIAQTYEYIGYSLREYIKPEFEEAPVSHSKIIENADTLDALTYIENVLEVCYSADPRDWNDIFIPGDFPRDKKQYIQTNLEETAEEVNTTLEAEGILWELEYSDGSFDFRPIGSEMMAEADEEFSIVASDKKWESAVSPYQDAFRLYRERTYGYEIPEKLYNSIEELAKVICVDLENWEDNREQNLSVYLDCMREVGLFEPNNIMHAELKDLISSMERTFQKAGAERKNRHTEIDRKYATLLLHQVSAYLTYIIRQYGEMCSEDSD